MQPRRIAIDCNSTIKLPGRYLSGVGRTTLELVRALLDAEPEYDFVLYRRTFRGSGTDWIGRKAATTTLRIPMRFQCSQVSWLIKNLGLVEATCRADLYHATNHYMPLRRPEKAVVTLHDAMYLTHPDEALVGHAEMARYVPAFARRCLAVITPSEHSRKDIVRSIGVEPKRVHVVPWGVSRDAFAPETDTAALRTRLAEVLGIRRPYFLSVSCDIGRKNTERLLRVYERLARAEPSNDLVLVWPGLPDRVRAAYSHPPLSDRNHFLGAVTDDVLLDLYCGATAMVFPSMYEGFGLPVLEAMSCGTPVISSNATSMPEVGGDAVLYVDPLDDDSILRALEAFENQDAKTRGLGDAGMRRAALFTWEKCARETLNVYRWCLEALSAKMGPCCG